MQHRASVLILIVVAQALGAGAAGETRQLAGAPMDLANPKSRWVVVEVVLTTPEGREQRLSRPVLAWYEAAPGTRSIRVPSREVERVLFAGRRPVSGSFTDFVWRFDSATGHVTSASLAGELLEPVGIGPIQSSARVSIVVELDTRTSGGYRAPRRLAGRTVIDYCADSDREDCTIVASTVYDARSGWVHAGGGVCAVWQAFRTHAYTTLGRARFREIAAGNDFTPDAAARRAIRTAVRRERAVRAC